MIDYTKKITTDREVNPIDNLDYSIESDRGQCRQFKFCFQNHPKTAKIRL